MKINLNVWIKWPKENKTGRNSDNKHFRRRNSKQNIQEDNKNGVIRNTDHGILYVLEPANDKNLEKMRLKNGIFVSSF